MTNTPADDFDVGQTLVESERMNICGRLFGCIDVPGFESSEVFKARDNFWNTSLYQGKAEFTNKSGNHRFYFDTRRIADKVKWVLTGSANGDFYIETDGQREDTVYDDHGFFATVDGKMIFQSADATGDFPEGMREEFETILSLVLDKPYKIISDIGFAVSKRGRRDHPTGIAYETIRSFYE
jgi:hypothetical protein